MTNTYYYVKLREKNTQIIFDNSQSINMANLEDAKEYKKGIEKKYKNLEGVIIKISERILKS